MQRCHLLVLYLVHSSVFDYNFVTIISKCSVSQKMADNLITECLYTPYSSIQQLLQAGAADADH